MPDLALESEAPGVIRDLVDDDLVRPVAEDDLNLDAGRSKKSPLARHVDLVIDPFDPALSTSIGLQLSVEGARLRALSVEIGFLHQGLERRAVGLAVDSPALFALIGRAEPGLVAQLAVARAIERLGRARAMTPTSTTTWRELALDLTTVHENARVLGDVTRHAPRLQRLLRVVVAGSSAASAGLVVGERFGCPFRLRAPVPAEEHETLARRLIDLEHAVADLEEARFERATAHLRGAGILDLERARRFGVDGPALRAAGGTDDFPADLGHVGSDVGVGATGCTAARILVRLADLRAALRRAHARLTQLEAEDDTAVETRDLHADLDGTADAMVRGPDGTTSCLLHVRAGVVTRLRLRPAGLPLLAALPGAMGGVLLDDVADVVASFGLRATALDR